MSKELIVSAGRHETRVAIIEDDQLVEIFHQREKEYSLAGSIHKGRVTRVLPGMQSAFVDIGLERDAFLYVSDFFEDNEEYDAVVSTVEEKVLKMEKGGNAAPAVIEAGAESATPAETAAAAPVTDNGRREDRGPRPGGQDRGAQAQDRGDRRGRRGRRRGGRGGGLPESKFFSPRNNEAPAAAPVVGVEEEPVVREERAAAAGDFMLLPGESLAKYSGGDEMDTQPAEATAAAVLPDPEFGSVPSWMSSVQEPVQEPVVEPEIEAVAEVVIEEPVVAAVEMEAEEGIGASEVIEQELGEAEVEATEEEGPEPARTPTSLTAALREQGNRYPHRASRRSRRRGRGEDREKRPGNGAPVAEGTAPAPEEKVVAPREERRPERGRTERPDRERSERGSERGERPERERPPLPSISDLLKEGQEIIVQIAKEPLGQKGARITSHIALPGRFVVYMPTVDHAGVSRKIPSDEERQRLKRVLQTHRQGVSGGFICRTAAEGKTEEELRADMHFLYNLWLDMRQKAEKKPAPVLLHHDLDLVQRILRDQLTTSFKTIWVDNEELYESILRFVERFQPALVGRVKLYTRANPIFDEFNITSELEKALKPKVWLKSGGYIVINQTEALVAIDINTGKYVGKSNRLEDTIVKVNTDAIREIVRQIRLRDLGGIIVVDFIDMDERKNRQKVMMALEDSMRVDRAPYKILQFNDFGLVAITRKRVKQSLERTLCAPCPYCEGAGYIKSVGTVVTEILAEAQRMQKALEAEQTNLVLRVNPEVAKVLKSNQNSFLQEIEEIVGRSVLVKSDALLHQTKFDLG